MLVRDPATGLPRYVDSYDVYYLGLDAASGGQKIDRGEAASYPLQFQPLQRLDGESLEMKFGQVGSGFMVAGVALATGPIGLFGEIADASTEAGRVSVEGTYGDMAFAYTRLGVDALTILSLAQPARGFAGKLGDPCLNGTLAADRRLATTLRRFFYDDRAFKSVSQEYWNEPADGSSLHHWLFPQRATWAPRGIRNAGFNLMELPPIIETPFGGLNQWMGMSRSPWAPVMDWGIRIAVPASIAGAVYGGYQLGSSLFGRSNN